MDREGQLARERGVTGAFVELAAHLVAESDLVVLLGVLTARSAEILDVAAAGVLSREPDGRLRVLAASTEEATLLELFQVQKTQGPCLDSLASGSVIEADVRVGGRWPVFGPAAMAAGYPHVAAIPLRYRQRTLGCLNLFMSHAEPLSPEDISVAQAFADVASMSIVQAEVVHAGIRREQDLQRALDSRIVIEQAKGMVALATGLDMDGAFRQLRAYARRHNRRLAEVTHEVVHRALDPGRLSGMR